MKRRALLATAAAAILAPLSTALAAPGLIRAEPDRRSPASDETDAGTEHDAG